MCLNAGAMRRQDAEPGTLIPVAHSQTFPAMLAGSANGGKGHGARSGDSKDEYIVPMLDLSSVIGFQGKITSPTNRSRVGADLPYPTLSTRAGAIHIAINLEKSDASLFYADARSVFYADASSVLRVLRPELGHEVVWKN
ncbi:MAG: hypothetical protein ACRCV9_15540 [Burkholderiaceae bacterium]